MYRFLWGFLLVVFASVGTFAADTETLIFDKPEMAGISGFRAYWDKPVVLSEDGATKLSDRGRFGGGQVADWSTEKPGAIAFDAVHRSLLLRFPQAAEKIAEKLKQGYKIQKAELILPFKDTEFFPMDYDYPAGMSFLGKMWVNTPPNWHAQAWALKQPWQADAQNGPTYNAAINGKRYWKKYGAGDKADRSEKIFGPTEVSHQATNGAMDITEYFSDPEFGKNLGERLRNFADCGLLVNKEEIYDARYWKGGYEWGVATGQRAIMIKTPSLKVTLVKGKSPQVSLPEAANIAELAKTPAGKPSAVQPSKADYEKMAKSFAVTKPAWATDWQWQRIAELKKMGSGKKDRGFPKSYEAYLKWLDGMLSMHPRAWKGFKAGEMSAEYAMYRTAIPEAVKENLRLYWWAWLMPDRKFSSLVQGYIGGKKAQEYYKKTKDWRGNFSVYRTYCHAMGTTNFNSWATTGAMFGGWIIEDEGIMEEARKGYDKWMTRTWTWPDGSSQESIDHYYFAHTMGPLKTIADFAPGPQERLAGSLNVEKHMDELIATWHPNLRRFISSSGRTGIAYPLYLQEGLNYIMHTISKDGGLTDVGGKEIAGRKGGAFALEFSPAQVSQQTLLSPWASAEDAQLVDNKTFPFEATRSYIQWGKYGRTPIWKKSYLGKHYGLASLDITTNETVPVMAQWRRKDAKVKTWTDLGTLLARYGVNDTEFLDSLMHGSKRRNPNGLVGIQGGPTLSVQGGNSAIILGSPLPDLAGKNRGGRPVPKEVKSLQMSMALFNFEATPGWKIYLDGKLVEQLPVKAKFGQKITIHDGVSYIGIIPIPASKIGERDTEVLISAKGVPTQMQGGGKIKVTLTIDAYNYKSEKALDVKAIASQMDKAVAGFVVQMGDAAEYQDFAAFQKEFSAMPLESNWDDEKGIFHVAYGTDKNKLEAGFNPTAPIGQPTTNIFPYRKYKGEWPYLAKGVHRDTSTIIQSTTGVLKKNGAVLKTQNGKMAYLKALPEHGAYIAINPFLEPVPFRLELPGGMKIEADGLLGQSRILVRPGKNEIHIRCVAGPADANKRLARSLLVTGTKAKSAVTVDGKPVQIQAVKNGYAIPLVTDWNEKMGAEVLQRIERLPLQACWYADKGVVADNQKKVSQWKSIFDGLATKEQSKKDAQPLLVKDALTGQKSIKFDGNDRLELPRFPLSADGSLFIVYRPGKDNSVNDADMFSWQPNNFGMAWGSDAGKFSFRPRLEPGGARIFSVSTDNPEDAVILGETHYTDNETGGDQFDLVVNGKRTSFNVPGDLANIPKINHTGKAYIGSRDKDLFWQGDIFAIIQYSHRLSNSEQAAVRQNLAKKYAIKLHM